MLSKRVLAEIAASIAEYPLPAAAAIDALKIVQRHNRWISDEDLRETAALLGMSAEDLDGIATFYSQLFRRPVARHVIQTCDGVMCWIQNGPRIAEGLRQCGMTLGESDENGRFTWLPVPCLGACHRAPAMLIDGELHEGVTAEGLTAILARYP